MHKNLKTGLGCCALAILGFLVFCLVLGLTSSDSDPSGKPVHVTRTPTHKPPTATKPPTDSPTDFPTGSANGGVGENPKSSAPTVNPTTHKPEVKAPPTTPRKIITPKPTHTYTPPPVHKTTKPPTRSGCDPNYRGACVPIASDVDCSGGSGNGPAYVSGPVYVIGSDIYDLDRDGDGVGCD